MGPINVIKLATVHLILSSVCHRWNSATSIEISARKIFGNAENRPPGRLGEKRKCYLCAMLPPTTSKSWLFAAIVDKSFDLINGMSDICRHFQLSFVRMSLGHLSKVSPWQICNRLRYLPQQLMSFFRTLAGSIGFVFGLAAKCYKDRWSSN